MSFQTQQVAESLLDYLLIELFDSLLLGKDGENDGANLYEIEQMGFRIGQKITEKITIDRSRFSEKIDVIKWICKDFWMVLFRKQADNLRTNHKGVFELTSNQFEWISKISASTVAESQSLAEKYVVLPQGLIRGALSSLGVSCLVKADIPQFPNCTFTIKIS
eukprot:TRINITY_DN12481_c0_g1_i1.p1 TRINITY_DN12481_c0_g1~~TRINITY_DN12481_c0_g1_i1.p1  ORF type:complete len:163 (+),score=20.82 TRINITY_DN12481_c0_g1_i1:51-539(+)